jgi:hypothetical protein
VIVVRVEDGPGDLAWTVEDGGSLAFDSVVPVPNTDAFSRGWLFRFRAAALGTSTLRLTLCAEGAGVLERLLFVVEVHEPQPSSARLLLRKRS